MNIWRTLSCLGLIAATALATSGCGRAGSSASRGDKPVVAATIWPMASLTQQLVGDDVTVACLLPPGLSPHSFEPTAQQMQDVSNAKLMVAVGLGVDHWAWSAARATGRADLPVFVFADAVGIAGDNTADHHHHEHADHDDDDDGEVDVGHEHVDVGPNPHLWLDPVLVQQMLPKLAAELEKALPDHKPAIEANLAKLQDDLKQLDRAYHDELAKLPTKTLVTFHNAFDRLADRYGLDVAATLMPIESPGGASPQAMEQVVGAIERYHLKVIFAEPQFSPQVADTLANDMHVQMLTLDPLGDPHVTERGTYQQMMRYNLRTLVQGLSEQ